MKSKITSLAFSALLIAIIIFNACKGNQAEEFDIEEIQKVLNDLSLESRSDTDFISVTFTDEGVFEVATISGRTQSPLPTVKLLHNLKEKKNITCSVRVVKGTSIVPSFGNVKTDPPFKMEEKDAGTYGGDQCRNGNTMDWYGTISFYARSIEIIAKGACDFKCMTTPALVSNNHVIARSDEGKPGEQIWTASDVHTATLKCVLKLSCNSSKDLATATLRLRPENVKLWEIRDLGKISKIRPPRIKEKIRKFGARTGPTSGTIKGIANIRVEGYLYNGVYVTSGGFGCPGDSGASVLSERNELLGIYSWGEDKPCEQNPKGYLWVLANSKRGMGEISIQEY